jgi:murein DD-endopeptidase MepM/ murein hydrolase activator NlpD
MTEPMTELFTRSRLLVLDFAHIPASTHDEENISVYFRDMEARGLNPRLAEHRHAFNARLLNRTHARYLVSQYSEDRSSMLAGSAIAAEGRTYHLGLDIFAQEQEPVFAPCDGEIMRSEYEPGLHNYGNFLILRPDDTKLPYMFFGHLAADKHPVGHVKEGEQIARLGTYEQLENGGWSVHLHLQLLTELPPVGEAPIGYSSKESLHKNQQRFPNPEDIFPTWNIEQPSGQE